MPGAGLLPGPCWRMFRNPVITASTSGCQGKSDSSLRQSDFSALGSPQSFSRTRGDAGSLNPERVYFQNFLVEGTLCILQSIAKDFCSVEQTLENPVSNKGNNRVTTLLCSRAILFLVLSSMLPGMVQPTYILLWSWALSLG